MNLLYSPKAAFKLLHSLHHLNGVAFDEFHLTYILNPAICNLLHEWARISGTSSYRLHCQSYCTGKTALFLGQLEERNADGEGRKKRKRAAEDGRFIHACEVVTRLKPAQMHHVFWLLSSVGAYSPELTVYVGKKESVWTGELDVPVLMLIVEVG